jgi:cytochrome c oxidase subunit 2
VAAFLENTPDYLRRWLHNPQEVKPGAKMPNLNLKPDELDALVAYLRNLK